MHQNTVSKTRSIELVRPDTVRKTSKAARPDVLDLVDAALELATYHWERKARELASTALADLVDAVLGRAWDISLPTLNPIVSIPPYIELVPETELEKSITNFEELKEQLLQKEDSKQDTFTQPQELKFIDWEYYQPSTELKGVTEIALFISTSGVGEGLAPKDSAFVTNTKANNVKDTQIIFGEEVDDYNPNRVLTAAGVVTPQGITWTILTDISNNNQKVETITIEGTDVDNIFPIGDYLNLTPGRYNYQLWTKQGNGQVIEQNPSSFDWLPTVELTEQPTLADGTTSNVFPSVTLITPDAVKNDVNAFKLALEVGNNIAYIDKSFTQAGNVLRYEGSTGNWVSVAEVSAIRNLFDPTKPLVLITDWQADSGALQYNSGTAEAVADSVFASLVKLDDQLGGAFSNTPSIYDKQGDLIYTPGNLFNSPFHFIGFGSDAVVNSEIIQRIGTAFPKLDSEKKPTQFVNTFPDLQMTTIDPRREGDYYDSYENNLEPTIEVWENVTFADNYYQSATPLYSQKLPAADLNIALGGYDEAQDRAGFTGADSENNEGRNSHQRATVWYEGTVDINQHDLGLVDEYPVHRRMGDFAEPEFANTTYPWYVADDTKGDFEKNNYQNRQWEGNGTGYYYSILGNGYSDRPSSEIEKRPVSKDNSGEPKMQGDFAVPTLFNGNFDAISYINDIQPIPS